MAREVWQDVRYGCRMLGKKPGFKTVACVAGHRVGANCAILVCDALLLRPFRSPGPEIMTVGSMKRLESLRATALVSSYRDYVDVRDRASSYEGLAAFSYNTAALPAIRR